jgi:hypothetical protein
VNKKFLKKKIMFIVIGAILIFCLITPPSFAGPFIGYGDYIVGFGFENTTPANLTLGTLIYPGFMASNITGTIDFGDGSQQAFGPS